MREAVAKPLTSELRLIWYAFFSWNERPVQRDNRSAWADLSDWNGLILGLSVVIVFETIALHLWLMSSFPRAIWLLTLSDIYAMIWLVGDARAMKLSCLELEDSAIDLRYGMRWAAHIPFAAIASIEPISGTEDDLWAKKPWDLKLSLIAAPDTLITLLEPMEIHGIYGFRKTVQKIGLKIENRSLLDQIEL